VASAEELRAARSSGETHVRLEFRDADGIAELHLSIDGATLPTETPAPAATATATRAAPPSPPPVFLPAAYTR